MFDDFYESFLKELNNYNYKAREEIIEVDERKLKQQIESLYNLIIKSNDYVSRSCKLVHVIQTKYEDALERLTNRLTNINRRFKLYRKRNRQHSQRRDEHHITKNKSLTIKDRKSKSPTKAKEPSKTRKISERSKTPEFNSKAKQNNDRISNKQKIVTTANNGSYLDKKLRADSRPSAKNQKTYASNSPLKSKPDTNAKTTDNKKFPTNKQFRPTPENPINKPKNDNNIDIKETRMPIQKESKSSLSNMGHKGSLYELKPKSTVERIKVSKDGTVETKESSNIFRSSVHHLKKYLTINPNSSGTLNNRKIIITSSSVIDEFMKKIEKRNKMALIVDDDDSDVKK